MDFVDEKCIVFDSEEENKFIYTDIHRDFRDHVEALISSNLGELDISLEKFYESCVKGRHGRDINQAVFERLIAMDDFTTFKRLMVKRNMELQLEALRTFNATPYKGKDYYSHDDGDDDKQFEAALRASVTSGITSPLPHPDDMRSMLDRSTNDSIEMTQEEMQNILHQSLMEMELLHRQEELEQAELERAVALSLAVESERLQILAAEAKESDFMNSREANIVNDDKKFIQERVDMSEKDVDAFSASQPRTDTTASSSSSPTKATEVEDSYNETNDNTTRTRRESKKISLLNPVNALPSGNFADPKPLKMRNNLQGSKPLPSISALPAIGGDVSSQLSNLSLLATELEDKKKIAQETLKRGQEQLAKQRQQEEELRKQLNIDPNEFDQRAQRMREQRDLLVAMKKAERQKILAKAEADQEEAKSAGIADTQMESQGEDDAKNSYTGLSETEIEQRRSNVRKALAYRMKMELMQEADNKSQKKQQQLQAVDKTLKQVDKQIKLNEEREQLLEMKIRRQQGQIARNMKSSASEIVDEDF